MQDTVIYERLAPNQKYEEATVAHLEDFAAQGLRTLCIAEADIPDEIYEEWKETYHTAVTSLQHREKKLDEAAELIEKAKQ